MQQLKPVTIIKHIELAKSVYLISFKRNFSFKAGQIIGLTNQQNIPPRLYSICSSTESDTVDILYQVKTDGQLTPLLEQNKVGDTLWITVPQGKFTYNNEPCWWIATGTGIAPFYAMFKSGYSPNKLIHGGRKFENIYFYKEFKQLTDYVVCCSQDKGRDLYEGRLTKYLQEYDDLPTNINYYICGSAEMVVDVRNLLLEKGVSYNCVITEIYF